jgi:hypothetical protein
MKIVGRILVLLVVFSALAGLMVLAVNASGTSSAPDGFDGARPQFRSDGDANGSRPEGGFNPESGQGRSGRGERGGPEGGSRWMFGLVKNVGIMAILVLLIALPRNIAKKKRKQAAVNNSQV